ncbi:hypothetical protein UFOVP225_45 [uncultured Caudovirales phage]|uniref:Uncharacterized protein n=1 Tax=uncultured Caudovirales phage TaxID=2100421 RepID=A0A6J7WN78_9CAUD|nr:hypothetical protein UFOVP113_58 [uncultured Caudovirales phage]CAB5219250.1 hypothetical protein UFOVP225_45 [uncultured Caudovirales phage]
MTVAELATTLAAFTTVLAFVGSLVARIMRNHTNRVVSDLIKEYLSELKPNHGSSLRDEVKGIRRDVVELKIDVASLEGKFTQHIEETNH